MTAYSLIETFTTPRPNRSQERYANLNDTELKRAQSAWDQARESDTTFNARHREHVAEQAAKEAARRAERRAYEADQQAKLEAPLLDKARSAFLRAGGSPESFEESKSAILARVREQIAVDAALGSVKPEPRLVREF
jgi:multidrug efflux pump subunit AcrA (membrane-fusion protein)